MRQCICSPVLRLQLLFSLAEPGIGIIRTGVQIDRACRRIPKANFGKQLPPLQSLLAGEREREKTGSAGVLLDLSALHALCPNCFCCLLRCAFLSPLSLSGLQKQKQSRKQNNGCAFLHRTLDSTQDVFRGCKSLTGYKG